jgi:hypothetical protein
MTTYSPQHQHHNSTSTTPGELANSMHHNQQESDTMTPEQRERLTQIAGALRIIIDNDEKHPSAYWAYMDIDSSWRDLGAIMAELRTTLENQQPSAAALEAQKVSNA